MKSKNNALKALAEQAKRRMKSGEYTDITTNVKHNIKVVTFIKTYIL